MSLQQCPLEVLYGAEEHGPRDFIHHQPGRQRRQAQARQFHLYVLRAVYTGRVAGHQAKGEDEMQAVSGALRLLANIVMAWNTAKMQAALDHWNTRRPRVPPELISKIAPTRFEGINLRGVFHFPVQRFAEQLLPSGHSAEKVRAKR